jgi:methylmalonyl-CoA/ethylmalonyl-CoA epimerase
LIKTLDHVGIAVKDASAVVAVYRALGLEPEGSEEVPSQKVKVTFIPVGDTRLELLEAATDDSPIAKSIEARGEGVHHLAFAVDDLEAALASCQRAGMRLIDAAPRPGAHHNVIAFVHPKSTHGVLVELCKKE